MKKFRLALMALAVISFAGLSSCNGGATKKEAQKTADSLVNTMNDSTDQAVKNADQTVVKDTEEVADTTADSATETEEGTEKEAE